MKKRANPFLKKRLSWELLTLTLQIFTQSGEPVKMLSENALKELCKTR